MTDIFAIFVAGLIMGLRHALDADHIAAVSTMGSSSWKIASKIGAVWGIGHTAAFLIAGAAALVFGLRISEALADKFELAVGVVLILLGFDLIRKVIREKIHAHEHTHDGSTHTHFHSHLSSDAHHHYHRPFAVGALHGLAGSAALFILILGSADSVAAGFVFLLTFGIGLILAMAAISSALSVLQIKNLRLVSAGASIVIGAQIVLSVFR